MTTEELSIIDAAIKKAVADLIDPIKVYLFGNGDDKNCLSRRMEREEAWTEEQKRTNKTNLLMISQLITWGLVAYNIFFK